MWNNGRMSSCEYWNNGIANIEEKEYVCGSPFYHIHNVRIYRNRITFHEGGTICLFCIKFLWENMKNVFRFGVCTLALSCCSLQQNNEEKTKGCHHIKFNRQTASRNIVRCNSLHCQIDMWKPNDIEREPKNSLSE